MPQLRPSLGGDLLSLAVVMLALVDVAVEYEDSYRLCYVRGPTAP